MTTFNVYPMSSGTFEVTNGPVVVRFTQHGTCLYSNVNDCPARRKAIKAFKRYMAARDSAAFAFTPAK